MYVIWGLPDVSEMGSWYTAINVFVITEQILGIVNVYWWLWDIRLLNLMAAYFTHRCSLVSSYSAWLLPNPALWASDAWKTELFLSSVAITALVRVTGNQVIPIQLQLQKNKVCMQYKPSIAERLKYKFVSQGLQDHDKPSV